MSGITPVIGRLLSSRVADPAERIADRRLGDAVKAVALPLLRYVTNELVGHIPFTALRHLWYRRALGIGLGPGCVILMHVSLTFHGRPVAGRASGITVGRRTIIGRECWLDGRGGVEIGDDVSMNRGVWIITGDHDVNDPAFAERYRPTSIGDRVFFGSRALVLKGVRIGEGAVIAAGAVVTKDVAPYDIVAGNPARVIGTRSRDLRYELAYRPELE